MDENLKKVEAILFSIGKKIELEELSRLSEITNIDDLKSVLYQLQEHYEKKGSSLMLIEEGNRWKLTVREKFMPIVQKIVAETELSKTIMETLAVIAWKYPILQSDVIKIRTNKAYDHLKELEESGFISRTKFGRTNKIKLTDRFFTYFDLPHDRQKAHDKFKKLIPEKVQKKLEKVEKDIDKQEQVLVEKKEKIEKYEEIRRKEKEEQEKVDKGDINLDDPVDIEEMEDKQQEIIDEEQGDEVINEKEEQEKEDPKDFEDK